MKKIEILLIVLLLLITLFLRVWKILEIPLLDEDEIQSGSVALDIIEYGLPRYIITPPFMLAPHIGPMMSEIIVPFIYLFGKTTLSLRIPSILIATLTIFITYLFSREFYDTQVAFLSSFLLAIFPFHVYVSRLGMGFILTPFFVILCLYFLIKLHKTKNNRYLYAFAFTLGLGINSRLSFLFFLFSLIPGFLINFLPKFNFKMKDLLISFLLFLVGLYPLIYYNLTNNFITISIILRSFPTTYMKVNLLDPNNLVEGVLERFPKILMGNFDLYQYRNVSTNSLFFSLFVLSCIFLPIATLRKRNTEFKLVKKDAFLFLNLLFMVVMISTLTVSIFRIIEYIMVAPLCVIIIGRALDELLRIRKGLLSYLLILLLICFIFVSEIYSLYNTLFINYPKSITEKNCPYYVEKLFKFISNFNYTQVIVDDTILMFQLRWFGVKRENLEVIFNPFMTPEGSISLLKDRLMDEKILYIFSFRPCLHPPVEEWYYLFVDFVFKNNKRAILEGEIKSDQGNTLYKIYHVI